MTNLFQKLVGLFVERVPVDEHGRPLPRAVPRPAGSPPGTVPGPHPSVHAPPHGAAPGQQHPGGSWPAAPQPAMPYPGMVQPAPPHQDPMAPQVPGAAPAPQPAMAMLGVALRAIVPPEYAAHLSPHGLQVVAAAGDLTSEQARAWGASVLIISAECLGSDLHLLQDPQLATVFVSSQPVLVPDQPGMVQVQEPVRASEIARAAREAADAFAVAHPPR